jgi:hypothetical protein
VDAAEIQLILAAKFVVAKGPVPFILRKMTLDRVLIQGAMGCLMVLLATGCGGFTASKSVSPASFLLPGIMQNSPPPPDPFESLTNSAPAVSLAQAR